MTKLTPAVKERIADLSKKKIGIVEIGNIIQEEMNVNISARSIKRIRQEFGVQVRGKNKPKSQPKPFKADTKFNQDGSQVHTTLVQMDEEMLKDPAFVLRAHGYDPDAWELTQHVHNVWQQNSVADGMKDLHQSKVTVKPKIKTASIDDLVKAMNRKIKPRRVSNKLSGYNSIVVPLFDLHFGILKLEMLKDSMKQVQGILSRGHRRVVIVIGGDLLHSDFMSKTQTASNTQLDHVDNIISLNEAAEFVSSIIEMGLKYSKEVQVHAISGNHDEDKQYLFLWGLSQKYPQVVFDNNLNTRTAFGFDQVGIMAAHGNLALKRLPMLFANEFPKLWANSSYREVMSGHFHTEKLTDESGVIMHAYGTPKPSDPYEYANGYTMTRKHLQIKEFNRTRLVATYEIE